MAVDEVVEEEIVSAEDAVGRGRSGTVGAAGVALQTLLTAACDVA